MNKYYFAALKKESNTLLVSQTKAEIADFLNIHPLTVARHVSKQLIYENDTYIIWRDIAAPRKLRTGFALQQPKK